MELVRPSDLFDREHEWDDLCRFVAESAQAAGFAVSRVSIWREGIGDRCDLRIA